MNYVLKKALATILAVVMLATVMSAAVFSTAALDAQYQTLVLDEEQTANIDQEGEMVYFSFVPDESGFYTFKSFADHDTYGYLYNSYMCELTKDDDGGGEGNFLVVYELEAGNQYYFGAKFYSSSVVGSFSVELSKIAAVTNMVVKPIELVENYHGTLHHDYDYFKYEWQNRLSYTIYFENGDTIKGTSDYFYLDDKLINIDCFDSQTETTPWTVGNTYNPTVSVFGYTTTVPVSIVPSPVKSVTVHPLKLYEGVDSYIDEYGWDEESGTYASYPVYSWIGKLSYTVEFNDGGVVEAYGTDFNYNDIWYSVKGETEQSYSNQWRVNETYYPTFDVLDVKATAEVSIVPFEPEEIVLDETYTASVESHLRKHYFSFTPEVSGMYFFESFANCEELPSLPVGFLYDATLDVIDSNSYGKHDNNFYLSHQLTAGETYYFAACFEGMGTGSFPVKLTKAPSITNIVVNPLSLGEKKDATTLTRYDDDNQPYTFRGYTWWEKISYAVFFDNNEYVDVVGTNFEYNGIYYSLSPVDDQSPDNLWSVGTYTPTFSIMGYTATAFVTIEAFVAPPAIALDVMTTADILSGGDYAYFSFTPEVSGMYVFASFAENADTYGHLYDADLNEITWDDEGGTHGNFSIDYDLEAGKEYYFAARYYDGGRTGSFPVMLYKAPTVTNIQIKPVQLIANDTAFGNESTYWDSETQTEIPYFYYWWYHHINYTVTINGETVEGKGTSFQYNGNTYSLSPSDNQYGNPWTLGNTYYPTVSVLGYEAPVTVEIVDTPIKSITFNVPKLIENITGYTQYYWNEQTNSEASWFYYNWENSLTYTVTFKNGDKATASGRWFHYDGNTYHAEFENTQSQENPWLPGNTYKVAFSLMGYKTSISLKVSSGTIKSITLDPIKLIENADGNMYYDYDKYTGERQDLYFHYHWFSHLSGKVTFADGSTGKLRGNNLIIGDNEYYVDIDYSDSQSMYSPWVAGKTYKVPATILGYSINIPVQIVPTPVQSITVKPLVLTSHSNGSDYGYFYRYNWRNAENFSFTINYKNGAKETYGAGDDLIPYYKTYYQVACDDNQWNEHWEHGNTYTATLSVLGCKTNVSITISDHSVSDNVEYIIQNDAAVVTGLFGSGASFTIPETLGGCPVTSILSLEGGEYEEIIIPDSVTMVSSSMLDEAYTLKSITIGSGVVALNRRTFANANALEEIIISKDNPEYASIDGIVYDRELTRIIAVPNAKTTDTVAPSTLLDANAYLSDNYQFVLDLNNTGTGYITEDGVTYNKEKTIVYSCSPEKTGSYDMPDTVETIAEGAFSFSNLEEVTVSNNVSSIVYYAFSESRNLKKVVLPDNLKSISEKAFAYCYNLSDINLPASLTTIGTEAFASTDISSINIPASVKRIGESAFSWANLEEVTFNEGLEEIGPLAFGGTDMTHVTFPNSLKIIGYGAFCETNIKSVDLGKGVEYIGDGAFGDCWIESIHIPANVKYLGMGAFSQSNLKSITFDNGLTKLGDGTFYNTKLTSIKIPESVTDIGYRCFENSSKLLSIDLPNKLQSLDGFAFHGTAWYAKQANGVVYIEKALYNYKGTMPANTKVTVKSGTEIIADYSFAEQKNLKTIVLPKSIKTIGYKAFGDCDGLTDVYFYGSKADRDKILVENENLQLFDATWHYNYCAHSYSNNCDTSCNLCGAKRSITHSYKDVVTKATASKNGKIVKKCSTCGTTSSTTTIYAAKTIKLSGTSYTYTGKTIKPTVSIKDSKGKTISTSNYTVKYASGLKKVGKYAVTITFKNNYSGSKTLYFTINPVKTSVSKLTAAKKAFTVSVAKKSTEVTGYEIQYSTSKSFTKSTTKTKAITSYKTTKTTIKSLKAKKTYYVRVRTYKTVGKTKYYSGWSTVKKVKTK